MIANDNGVLISPDLLTALQQLSGQHIKHWQTQSVAGGCIHDSAIVTLPNDIQFFVKQNTPDKYAAFEHEANGLLALGQANIIPVAKPLVLGNDGQHAFLILSVINEASPRSDFWEQFGERLAQLHLNTTGDYFGWQHDNTIGRIAQRNTPHEDWVTFFRESRLMPQFALAEQALGSALMAKGEKLMARLGELIHPPLKPQLIHGDLWSGNFMVNYNGEAALIDPAVYYGHAEADLAMTHLFGGFDSRFYAAYQSVNPLAAGYEERAEIYNLYHLLNHLNLFGTSYLASVKRTIERFV